MSSKAFNANNENNKKNTKTEAGKRPAWKLFIVPAVLIVAVIVAACVILLPSLRGDQSSAGKLMSKYYTNLYSTSGDLKLLPECMPMELRDAYEQVSTMGGVSTNFFTSYRAQMKETVGDNMTVDVKITSTKNAGASKLAATKKEFSGAETVSAIEYDVTVKGDSGEEKMQGTTNIVSIDGKWFLTTYNLVLDKKA